MENSVVFWGLLIILVGLALAILQRPRISVPGKMIVVFCTVSVISLCRLEREVIQAENKEKLDWHSFVQAHNCKVVEPDVPAGTFAPAQTGWLCDDGVKYYKPKSYSKMPER